MRILLYHKKLDAGHGETILRRASERAHLLKKTILWDLGLLAMLLLAGTLLPRYSSVIPNASILRCFLPINESVWEHLKLLFYPAALIAVIRYLVTGNLQKGIVTTYAMGLVQAELLFIILCYTLHGVLGTPPEWLNTAILCTCGIYLTVYLRYRANHQKRSSLAGLLTLLLMAAGFVWFTYAPPQIGLFMV